MDIRSLKADAAAAVERSSGAKQVALIYSVIVLVFSAVSAVMCLVAWFGIQGLVK